MKVKRYSMKSVWNIVQIHKNYDLYDPIDPTVSFVMLYIHSHSFNSIHCALNCVVYTVLRLYGTSTTKTKVTQRHKTAIIFHFLLIYYSSFDGPEHSAFLRCTKAKSYWCKNDQTKWDQRAKYASHRLVYCKFNLALEIEEKEF